MVLLVSDQERLQQALHAADQPDEGLIINNDILKNQKRQSTEKETKSKLKILNDLDDDLTMYFFFIRALRKADQEAIDLAWKEEKQRINSDANGSQSYSAIKNSHE